MVIQIGKNETGSSFTPRDPTGDEFVSFTSLLSWDVKHWIPRSRMVRFKMVDVCGRREDYSLNICRGFHRVQGRGPSKVQGRGPSEPRGGAPP